MTRMAGILLIVTIGLVGGCSSDENYKCQGIYRHAQDAEGNQGSRAILGFIVKRSWFIEKFNSPDQKGWLVISLTENPNRNALRKSGILDIKADNEFGIHAYRHFENTSDWLSYDLINGSVYYQSERGEITSTYSGTCRLGQKE